MRVLRVSIAGQYLPIIHANWTPICIGAFLDQILLTYRGHFGCIACLFEIAVLNEIVD